MPYLALARKYRPQRFEDIVGQEHVSQTLQKAIDSNRVHHAYLFTGIRGVGKTTAARVLAKALNCENGPTNEPCNECVACTEITAGRSMDVMELDAASNRGIDDIRELREGVRYTTARDRYKIIIIDEVHMLTEAAFNALLKTLEEPPPHVRFVLATTDPQKLPATILSRCQRFDFRRVTASALVAHLQKLCTSEGIAAEEAALSIVVRQTQGSVRDALSLLDQLLAASSDSKLTADKTMEILGVADRKRVLSTIKALLEQDAKAALTTLRDVFVTGYDVTLFINEVLAALRDAMVLRIAGRNRELVDLSQLEIEELEAIIGDRNPYDLHHYLRVMLDAVEQIRRSEFPMFAAEEALIRVASAGQSAKIPKLIQRLSELEQRLSSRTGEAKELFKEPEAPPENPPESGAEEVPAAPEDVVPAPPKAASEESIKEGPALLEATDSPIQKPPLQKPAVEPPVEQPAEETPVERPAEASPPEQPAEEIPVERPAASTPPAQPAEEIPVERPADASPPEQPVEGLVSVENELPETVLMEAVDTPIDDIPPPPGTFALKPGVSPADAQDDDRSFELPPVPSGPALPGIAKGAKKASRRKIDHELLAEMPQSTPTADKPEPAEPTAPEPEKEPVEEEPEIHRTPPYPDLVAADRDELWSAFLVYIALEKPGILAEFDTRVLEACVVSKVTDKIVTVTFPAGAMATLAPLRLKESLPDFLALEVEVELESSSEIMLDNSLEADRQRRRDSRKNELDKELRAHPHVETALGLFGGEVHSTDIDPDALEDQD
jgi:DNA polymerase III subunit gamma/tau